MVNLMLRRKCGKIYYLSVPIKNEHDNGKTIRYKLKFIDMTDKLSNLVDNLFRIYEKECKACLERKKNQVRI